MVAEVGISCCSSSVSGRTMAGPSGPDVTDTQRRSRPITGGSAGSGESAHPELLGRTGERQVLADLLRAARAGHGGAVVLRGEAGIGKSALLEDLADNAQDCC